MRQMLALWSIGPLSSLLVRDKAGALPASDRSRRVKARGQVCGPKGRPFKQRVIAVCRACHGTLLLSNTEDATRNPFPGLKHGGLPRHRLRFHPKPNERLGSHGRLLWAIGTLVLAVVAVLQELIRGLVFRPR